MKQFLKYTDAVDSIHCKITPKAIRLISPPLLAHVHKLSAKTGEHWLSSLRRILHPEEGSCKMCGGTTFLIDGRRYKLKFQTYCGTACLGKDPEIRKKMENTSLKRYGVTQVLKSKRGMDLFKKTMTERHGAAFTASSPKLLAKMKKTLMKNHGVTETFKSSEIQAKARKWLEDPKRIKQMTDRYKETCQERYGVDHAFHIAEVVERQQKTALKYSKVRIKGKTFHLQGYEEQAVRYLINEIKVSPSEVLTSKSEMPEIYWKDSKGGNHRYYPDIYAKVKGVWRVIEVKSTYTAGIGNVSSYFYSMKRKLQATIDAGHSAKLIIVDKDKIVLVTPPLSTVKELRRTVQEKLLTLS